MAMKLDLGRVRSLVQAGNWKKLFHLTTPQALTKVCSATIRNPASLPQQVELAEQIDLGMTQAIADRTLKPGQVLGEVCLEKAARIDRLRECLAAETAEVAALEEETAKLTGDCYAWEAYVKPFELLAKNVYKAEIFGIDHPKKTTPRASFAHGPVAAVTETGIRIKDEDSAGYVELSDGRKVCVIADGNGIEGGAASRLAVQMTLLALEAGHSLADAILIANRVIAEELRSVRAPQDKLPGSTIVVVMVDEKNNLVQIGQVGDARAEWIEQDNAWLLTLDHSMRYAAYGIKYAAPTLPLPEAEFNAVETAVEALDIPSNMIISNLGVANLQPGETRVSPPNHLRIIEIPLADSPENARLVLHCDGAVSGVKQQAIANVTRGAKTVAEAAENIVNMAYGDPANGRKVSEDNITALVLEITGKKLDLSDPSKIKVSYQGKADVAPAASPAPQPATSPAPQPATTKTNGKTAPLPPPLPTREEAARKNAVTDFEEFFDRSIAPLSPEAKRETLDQVRQLFTSPAAELTGLAAYLAKVRALTARQILAIDDHKEQLRLLAQPLALETLNEVIGHYLGNADLLSKMIAERDSKAAAVREGADLVAIAYIRQQLEFAKKFSHELQTRRLAEQLAKFRYVLDDLDIIIRDQELDVMAQQLAKNLLRDIERKPAPRFGKDYRRRAKS